jgi:hypothetical protein
VPEEGGGGEDGGEEQSAREPRGERKRWQDIGSRVNKRKERKRRGSEDGACVSSEEETMSCEAMRLRRVESGEWRGRGERGEEDERMKGILSDERKEEEEENNNNSSSNKKEKKKVPVVLVLFWRATV